MRPTYSKYIVISVLRLFKIRYTSNYVQKLLEENSDGDNLWGILSVLQIYGLIVEPRRITSRFEPKDIDINKPFITEYDGNILLIKKIEGDMVVGCMNGKDTTYCKNDFFTNWGGIIVSIHKGESVGEPNFKKHKNSDLYIRLSQFAIILSLITMCVYRMAFFNVPFYIAICFLLSFLGANISYQIERSNFSPNIFMNNLCSLIKRSSCNQINNRKNRYITALGFSYFCSLCVFILLPLDNYALTICIIAISSIEVIWSLVLQLIRREFCINCIVVQVIVTIMILICIPYLAELNLHDFIQQGILFLSIFTIIFSITAFQVWPHLVNKYRYRSKSRLMDYFKKIYLDNIISSKESTIKIFLNPFCNPCKEEFIASYNLLVNLGQSKVTPIIIASDSKGEKVGMTIIDGKRTTSIFQCLKEWYYWGYLRPEEFERHFCFSSNDKSKLTAALQDNLNLAHRYDVQYTPSIICNGIKMPSGVSLVDILTQ